MKNGTGPPRNGDEPIHAAPGAGGGQDRCKAACAPSTHESPPRNQTTTRENEFLLFRLSGRCFALPLDQVARIDPARNLLPCQNAPLALEALLPAEHRRIPVLSLCRRFGLPPSASSRPPNVIVLSVPPNQYAGGQIGVFADGISAIERLYPHEIHLGEVAEQTGRDPVLAGWVRVAGRRRPLLDARRLLSPEEGRQLALWIETWEGNRQILPCKSPDDQ